MIFQAVEFYSSLIGRESRDNIRMAEDFLKESERVSTKENEMLEADFSNEEIKKAIDSSYDEGAPSPDGFFFLLYQKFYESLVENLYHE
jgi:TPP-dependent pyruvate/acetoin dehydrogenase alpha subunit